MTKNEENALGCLIITGFLLANLALFAASVFIIAAAVRWVISGT